MHFGVVIRDSLVQMVRALCMGNDFVEGNILLRSNIDVESLCQAACNSLLQPLGPSIDSDFE